MADAVAAALAPPGDDMDLDHHGGPEPTHAAQVTGADVGRHGGPGLVQAGLAPEAGKNGQTDSRVGATQVAATPPPSLPTLSPFGSILADLSVDNVILTELTPVFDLPAQPSLTRIAAGQVTPAVLSTLTTMPSAVWWKDLVWFAQQVALGISFVEFPHNCALVQTVGWHETAHPFLPPSPAAATSIADALKTLL